MNKKILQVAIKEFNKLKKQYRGFVNVAVDNWRDYRFIFDIENNCACKNGCLKCPLYLLLKNKNKGIFNAGLYLANKEDKKLFGRQKYLNCKSLMQYQKCYVNFLVKKTNNEKDIKEELKLLKNFRIIFSKETNSLRRLEDDFRKAVIKNTLARVNKNKRKIIISVAKRLLDYKQNDIINL